MFKERYGPFLDTTGPDKWVHNNSVMKYRLFIMEEDFHNKQMLFFSTTFFNVLILNKLLS